ncbi:hypothetical protein [Haladaptatus sp. ZSTT2]|uniref:hypothetical protein n=1 Tax=Haladaptatus sp. ZSTT2 TaxID=3120515 RepID=UPI00300EE5A5
MSGVVTISIEVELGWGFHDIGGPKRLSDRCEEERKYLQNLLLKCDEVGIPISFDIVGHLTLSECDGTHEGHYPADWFANDPGTNLETNPDFYAPDMIAAIEASKVSHELCTHTFSHVLCDRMGDDCVNDDIAHAQRIHETQFGKKSVSFVPPRHFEPSATVLRENGIEIVRKSVHTDTSNKVTRFFELLVSPPLLDEPQIVDGIVETYCTSYQSLTASSLPIGQRESHAVFKPIPRSLRQQLHLRRMETELKAVVEKDGYAHFWCHLWDLSNEHQWGVVEPFLDMLATYRDMEGLQVLTMSELNNHVRTQRATGVELVEGING